ncbi:MAG: hypothetical protein NTZ72_02550 [Afipia sp.]|nr:hypothetical protein [Afipia sp.]
MTTENLAKRGSKSKPCVACASKIPASAIKCVKCGSYQNYRRYFEFGNTTIALLIALISVVSLAHKNISDLYRSLFVDPFEPIVVASVSSIERKKVSILFQNNGSNRIVPNNGALCRVPIFKSELAPDKNAEFKYPKPSEISAVHLVVYESIQEDLPLEAGRSLTKTYLLHQTRPEEGRPFIESATEIRPYCFVGYIDQRGREDGIFIFLQAIKGYFLQKELVSEKK